MSKKFLAKAAVAGASVVLLAGMAAASVGNDHTGFDSENNASLKVKSETEITNENHADLENGLTVKASTGDNEVEKNTGAGTIHTGGAEANVTLANTVNKSNIDVNACNGCNDIGDISVMNSVTGAESENNAWVKINNELEVKNQNHADVDNHVCVQANTGGNEVEKNTGAGSITTGNATANVTVTNDVNSSTITVH